MLEKPKPLEYVVTRLGDTNAEPLAESLGKVEGVRVLDTLDATTFLIEAPPDVAADLRARYPDLVVEENMLYTPFVRSDS